MNYCPKCGHRLDNAGNACTNCGFVPGGRGEPEGFDDMHHVKAQITSVAKEKPQGRRQGVIPEEAANAEHQVRASIISAPEDAKSTGPGKKGAVETGGPVEEKITPRVHENYLTEEIEWQMSRLQEAGPAAAARPVESDRQDYHTLIAPEEAVAKASYTEGNGRILKKTSMIVIPLMLLGLMAIMLAVISSHMSPMINGGDEEYELLIEEPREPVSSCANEYGVESDTIIYVYTRECCEKTVTPLVREAQGMGYRFYHVTSEELDVQEEEVLTCYLPPGMIVVPQLICPADGSSIVLRKASLTVITQFANDCKNAAYA